MLSANPSLDYDSMYAIMSETSMIDSPAPDNSCTGFACREGDNVCSGGAYNAFPSNHYGYGEVDAFAAVVAANGLKQA